MQNIVKLQDLKAHWDKCNFLKYKVAIMKNKVAIVRNEVRIMRNKIALQDIKSHHTIWKSQIKTKYKVAITIFFTLKQKQASVVCDFLIFIKRCTTYNIRFAIWLPISLWNRMWARVEADFVTPATQSLGRKWLKQFNPHYPFQ